METNDFNEITRLVLSEFNTKRVRAEAVAQKNIAKANSYPVFKKIEALEKELVFEMGKVLAENNKSATLKKQLAEVRKTKTEFLKSIGLTESDLTPKYECAKCKDVGFVGTVECECFEKARNEKIIKSSNFGFDKDKTFDSFKTDIAKNENQAKTLEKLKQTLEKWCEKYPNVSKKNVLLIGKTGVGKTFSATAVASEMANKGYSVCFVSSFQMNQIFLKYHTTFDKNKDNILIPLTKSDILVIDDLGTEPPINNVTINYLNLTLAERERQGLSTIVTSNLSSGDILTSYGERIYSRLFSKNSSLRLEIKGDDLRI